MFMRKELCSYLVINIHEEKVMLLGYCSYLVIDIDERIYIVYFVIEKKNDVYDAFNIIY